MQENSPKFFLGIKLNPNINLIHPLKNQDVKAFQKVIKEQRIDITNKYNELLSFALDYKSWDIIRYLLENGVTANSEYLPDSLNKVVKDKDIDYDVMKELLDYEDPKGN